jgi:K(+)-stimulated pyrophosphate-energized sodium pump
MSLTWIITVLCIIAVTLAYVAWNYIRIRKMPEGTADMVDMAAIIRSGANAFMKTEYKTISIVVVLISLTLSLFVEKTAGITFLVGAAMSSCACVLGMKSATYANVRTANKARESMSIGDTVKVALCGGSISGLSVQAFGMFGLVAVLLIWGGVTHQADGGGLLTRLQGVNASIMRVSTYSLGCSLVAMFNRVAGGNYTKAADISADILGKIRNDLPEDDSRIPNVIADFIGDNVNDIAGNCSDLLESFVATMSATIMIAVIMFEKFNIEEMFNPTVIFPVVLAGAGLLSCLTGMLYANVKKMGNDPSHELNLATWISAGLTVILGLGASWLIFGKIDAATLETYGWRASWLSPWICAVLGLASGVAIGSCINLAY